MGGRNKKQHAAASVMPNQKNLSAATQMVNSLANSASKLRKILKQVQAVDTTPWFVLEEHSSIIEIVQKNNDGVVRLNENKYDSPIFNPEDVANQLEVYVGKVCVYVCGMQALLCACQTSR